MSRPALPKYFLIRFVESLSTELGQENLAAVLVRMLRTHREGA